MPLWHHVFSLFELVTRVFRACAVRAQCDYSQESIKLSDLINVALSDLINVNDIYSRHAFGSNLPVGSFSVATNKVAD